MEDELKLGDQVKDTVTGFTGTLTARVEHLKGVVRGGVEPNFTDGKADAERWFDMSRLEKVS